MSKTVKKGDVIEEFYELSGGEQVKVLWDALDFMQQYNGRSRYDCIILAMGYELVDEGKYIKNQ